MKKDPGREAYEADVAKKPTYHHGGKRPKWEDLPEIAQESWRRNARERVGAGE